MVSFCCQQGGKRRTRADNAIFGVVPCSFSCSQMPAVALRGTGGNCRSPAPRDVAVNASAFVGSSGTSILVLDRIVLEQDRSGQQPLDVAATSRHCATVPLLQRTWIPHDAREIGNRHFLLRTRSPFSLEVIDNALQFWVPELKSTVILDQDVSQTRRPGHSLGGVGCFSSFR